MIRTFRAALLGAAVLCALGARAAERPPNVVIIFTDDQGYQDVGCFGSPNIKTPNLDRMAREGRKFTDFHVAASVCSPSRAALLTGSYPPRAGVTRVLFPRDKVGLSPKEHTIADALKGRGYATAAVGKWHLGHLPKFLPVNNGFDSYFGIPYSNDMDGVKGKNRSLDHAWINNDWSAWNVPLMENDKVHERPAKQDTLTKRYTERAVKFIHANKNKPFFLYLAHTMPHIPLFVSSAWYDKDPHKAYQRTIQEIDWSVGEVLKAVKDAGVDDKTLVVFTSDNGPWLSKKHHGGSAKPLRDGKFSIWEGGFRVPCIMRFPGKIPANTVCDELASTIDLLPTVAKLAGATLPADRKIDGKDIWPLMTEAHAKSPHEAFYFFRGTRLQAMRYGKWKYKMTGGRRRPKKGAKPSPVRGELYDLSKDIREKNNVAAQNPELVATLTAMAKKFNAELQANKRPTGTLGR